MRCVGVDGERWYDRLVVNKIDNALSNACPRSKTQTHTQSSLKFPAWAHRNKAHKTQLVQVM